MGRLTWVYHQQISNCYRPVLTYWPTDWCHQWVTDCWSCMAFCCNSFLCCGSCVQWVMGFFYMSDVNNFLLVNYIMLISLDIYFKTVWVAKSCMTVCFTYSLSITIFLNIDISQGSVMTRLGYVGVFKYEFVTNFLLSLTVKEFWKSVNIWRSYGQEYGVLFFWLTV